VSGLNPITFRLRFHRQNGPVTLGRWRTSNPATHPRKPTSKPTLNPTRWERFPVKITP